jgi:hypothetical protein
MIYTNENMNLFWTTKEDLYNYTNNLTSVVYAFCWRDSKPTDNQWPFMVEESFYFGMAGGLKEDYIGDRKSANRTPMLSTAVHQRFKQHMPKFDNPKGNFGSEKRKYELYHSLYPQMLTCDKTFYVALLTPKKHIQKTGMRNLLSLVESEQIYQYQKMFGKLPALNLAEADDFSDSRKNENSISQSFIKGLKKQDLTQWITEGEFK